MIHNGLFCKNFAIRTKCEGENSCQLVASNAEYSDPCGGVVKYLQVNI